MNTTLLRRNACCVVLLLVGCSGRQDQWSKNLPATVPARGIVLLDGQPLEGASVVFAPVAPGTHAASAVTGSGGRFELKAFPSKAGAVPGSYQVGLQKTVEAGRGESWNPKEFGVDAGHAEKAPPPTLYKNLVPAQYENAATSGLTAVIPDTGTSDLKVELKSAP